MIYIVRINDKEYEVEVEKGRANIAKTTIVTTSESAPGTAPVQPAVSPKAAQENVIDGTAVKAPMPGTVIDIKVLPGKSVNKGEVLLILEAMKMENEITAPNSGVVKQVLAGKGTTVATDDILIILQ
ncbi:MAG: biotin/lipoyl attachment protein [Oscillospiraceae bacterium]|jgi:biotin carboxyl carrier protein|nr:biotin/lipoyl attachment protein [Oscillospiraceae bacterium]